MKSLGKALVVDWNVMATPTIADALTKVGYECLSETRFEGARRALDASPAPKLLVIHSGVSHDTEALAFIAYAVNYFAALPIVIISDLARHEISLSAGRWVHVQKPFDTYQLMRAVDTARGLAASSGAVQPRSDTAHRRIKYARQENGVTRHRPFTPTTPTTLLRAR